MKTLAGDEIETLEPGDWWIELSFERPTEPAAVRRALARMGFSDVVTEEPGPSVGAVSSRFRAAPSLQFNPLAVQPPPASSVRSTAVSSPLAAELRARVQPTAPLRAYDAPSAAPAASLATPAMMRARLQAAESPLTPTAKPRGFLTPGGGGGGGGDASQSDGGGGGGADQGQPSGGSDQGSPAAAPDQSQAAATAAPPDQGPSAQPAPTQPSPAPQAPQGSLVPWVLAAGAAAVAAIALFGLSSNDVRFVGRLTRPIKIRNQPGMWWKCYRKLSVDRSSEPSWRVEPHQLEPGKTYELRFVSRDKTARSAEDVLTALGAMGFSPAAAMPLRRNMRIPGRPSTTVSEWIGMGTWRRPLSVVTTDDPFYFADAREVEL